MSLGKLSWQFAAGIKSYSIIFYHTSAHVRSSVVSTQQEPLQTVPVSNVSLVNTRLHCNQMCRAPLCSSVNAAKGQQVSADLSGLEGLETKERCNPAFFHVSKESYNGEVGQR